MEHLHARARSFSLGLAGFWSKAGLGSVELGFTRASLRARARIVLIGLAVALGGCQPAGLSSGPVMDTEKEARQGQPDEPESDDGGLDVADPDLDEPETIIASYACEQDSSCPSHRIEPWLLWTDGSLRSAPYNINYQSQSSFFGQLEISVNRGEYYDLPRITEVYVDRDSMNAYLRVAGLPDKSMPLRNSVMQGQSVWQLGTWSVESETVTSWWLTMRNSRWVTPVKAAVDLCMHASQTDCHTLYLEVSEDYGL